MTELAVSLVVLVPALPVASACASGRPPTRCRRGQPRGRGAVAVAALTLSAIGLPRARRPVRHAVPGRCAGGRVPAVDRARRPGQRRCSRPPTSTRRTRLLQPARARRSYYQSSTCSGRRCWRCRSFQPRRRLAADRSDDRRVSPAGRLQRQANALEAGWKLLVLTSLGLTVTLFGIVVLFVRSAASRERLRRFALRSCAGGLPVDTTGLVAFLLLIAGLAAKIGWAPVHNWLPDAHSEAPAPISALLSGGVAADRLLVAWRRPRTGPALGPRDVQAFFGFGLLRSRSRSRSCGGRSVETPARLLEPRAHGCAGARHRLRDAAGDRRRRRPPRRPRDREVAWILGGLPLLRLQPSIARRPPTGIGRSRPALGWALGLSLVTLSGLPPSPLFASELFVLLGGIEAGRAAVVVVAAGLLAAGFLGLAHVLIDGIVGRPRGHRRSVVLELAEQRALVVWSALLLAAISASALVLPGSSFGRGDRAGRGMILETSPERVEGLVPHGPGPRRPLRRASRVRVSRRPGHGAVSGHGWDTSSSSAARRSPRRIPASWTWRRVPTGTSARLTTCEGSCSTAIGRCGPLVDHPPDPAAWTVPVAGADVHQVAVGPIHAGVIESGHFRFHVVGERILLLDPRLFYKHRGLERLAEGRTADEGLAVAQRACAACSVANGVAYAMAVERAPWAHARRPAASRTHAADRAGARLQPPPRPLGGLRRRRVRRSRDDGLRGAQGARSARQTQSCSATASCSAPSRSAAP